MHISIIVECIVLVLAYISITYFNHTIQYHTIPLSVPNVMVIQSIVDEKFLSGLKWWTNQLTDRQIDVQNYGPTLPTLEPCC